MPLCEFVSRVWGHQVMGPVPSGPVSSDGLQGTNTSMYPDPRSALWLGCLCRMLMSL